VKLGNPWALDAVMIELCADNAERAAISELVVDEYRRQLVAMPRDKMLAFYSLFYEDPSDADKDWLLGEIVESIEAGRN
jgi:hypothetical protein